MTHFPSLTKPQNPFKTRPVSGDIFAILLIITVFIIRFFFLKDNFWTDPTLHSDIIGVDSEFYFSVVRDSAKTLTFERRPMFVIVLLSLRSVFKFGFGMSDAEAALAAFSVVGASVPIAVYAAARVFLPAPSSLIMSLLLMSSMVVTFHQLVYESYALTMAVGFAACAALGLAATRATASLQERPGISALLAVIVVTAAGWTAITMYSLLLPVLFIAVRLYGIRKGAFWSAVVTIGVAALFLAPSVLVAGTAESRNSLIDEYFSAARLLSGEAWRYVLVANFAAALLYPGKIMAGSHHPRALGPEDWMGVIYSQALDSPASWFAVAVLVIVALLSFQYVRWHDRMSAGVGAFTLGIWGVLLSSLTFFTMWAPGEAALFVGCTWPFFIMLVVIGRKSLQGRAGMTVDGILLVTAIVSFYHNTLTLNATALFYSVI